MTIYFPIYCSDNYRIGSLIIAQEVIIGVFKKLLSLSKKPVDPGFGDEWFKFHKSIVESLAERFGCNSDVLNEFVTVVWLDVEGKDSICENDVGQVDKLPANCEQRAASRENCFAPDGPAVSATGHESDGPAISVTADEPDQIATNNVSSTTLTATPDDSGCNLKNDLSRLSQLRKPKSTCIECGGTDVLDFACRHKHCLPCFEKLIKNQSKQNKVICSRENCERELYVGRMKEHKKIVYVPACFRTALSKTINRVKIDKQGFLYDLALCELNRVMENYVNKKRDEIGCSRKKLLIKHDETDKVTNRVAERPKDAAVVAASSPRKTQKHVR